MAETALKAHIRKTTGKANVGRLRREGSVPGVLYGIDKPAVSLAINRRELEKLLSETHSLIRLDVDGHEESSVIKEIQYHPVKGTITHIDLQRVKAGQEIHVSVPLKFVGEAPGVKLGGVFQSNMMELDISTLPKYLPGELEVDISKMEIGDILHIEDIKIEHITFNHEPDDTICSIALPKKVEEAEEAEEIMGADAEDAEPEVITSKSKDDDSKGDEG
ncbi:MAG: 50S ribosomal protein L25 [Calditrichales bacterium]|nr:MAG: 50S ribosomal protein L25 [Calditrichales bacterium]